jgi:hypothetical protein
MERYVVSCMWMRGTCGRQGCPRRPNHLTDPRGARRVMIGVVRAQVMDTQNEVEACNLPRAWKVEYSDMLMANEDDRLGQEVDLPFWIQNGLRIWTGTRTRPAAMAVQHENWPHSNSKDNTMHISGRAALPVVTCTGDGSNRCSSEACALEGARAQQIRTDRDVPAAEKEDIMMCVMSAGASVAARSRRDKRSQS